MNIKVNGNIDNINHSNSNRYSENEIEMNISKGEIVGIEKYITIVSTRDYEKSQLIKESKKILDEETIKGYETLYKEHCEAWNKRWETADIKIDGDILAQQGIRYNLFQLFSTYYGEDSRLNIGPKGFTGEKYGGATYWDTEAYCLPVYLGVTDKQV